MRRGRNRAGFDAWSSSEAIRHKLETKRDFGTALKGQLESRRRYLGDTDAQDSADSGAQAMC